MQCNKNTTKARNDTKARGRTPCPLHSPGNPLLVMCPSAALPEMQSRSVTTNAVLMFRREEKG